MRREGVFVNMGEGGSAILVLPSQAADSWSDEQGGTCREGKWGKWKAEYIKRRFTTTAWTTQNGEERRRGVERTREREREEWVEGGVEREHMASLVSEGGRERERGPSWCGGGDGREKGESRSSEETGGEGDERRKMKPCSPQLRWFPSHLCEWVWVWFISCYNALFQEWLSLCACVCVWKGEVKRLTAVLLLSDGADNITGVHEAQELWTHKQTREVRLHRAASVQLISSWKIVQNIWKNSEFCGDAASIWEVVAVRDPPAGRWCNTVQHLSWNWLFDRQLTANKVNNQVIVSSCYQE